MSAVYAVFREGVYRHGCGGIFSASADAIAAARALAHADCDDHHTYEVVPFILDTATTITPQPSLYKSSPTMDEVAPIFSCTKATAQSARPVTEPIL